MPVGRKLHLAAAINSPNTRVLDRNTATAERHLPRLVAVPDSDTRSVVLTLHAHNLDHLFLHQFGQHAEADADRQGQEPLPCDIDKLAQRLLYASRQLLFRETGLHVGCGCLLHGGSSFGSRRSPRTLPSGADEAWRPPSSSTSYGTSSVVLMGMAVGEYSCTLGQSAARAPQTSDPSVLDVPEDVP